MSVILSKKAVSLGSDVVSKPPSIRPTRLSLKKSANRSIRSNSSSPSKNNPSIPLSSKSSTIYFRTPDGRIIDIPPSKMTEDVLDWDTTRHFTVLTWGEKIILGFVHATRVFSKQWITHILLVLVLLIYTALGGVMFHYVEGSHENRIKINLDDERIKLSRKIWLLRNVTDEAVWYETFFEDIKRYEQEIVSAPTAVTPDRDWDFFGSLFFSGTVYTTIGYGNVVPCTDYGRGLTIVYAFFGIPLLLIILADLGKVLTRAIKFGWSFVRLFYYTGSCRRLRSTGGGALKGFIINSNITSAKECIEVGP
uniref:Potassium channel domain-containing protein n=1 Tax=Strigamia maritima TaxID=126957 RepID=T1IHU8_STRMM